MNENEEDISKTTREQYVVTGRIIVREWLCIVEHSREGESKAEFLARLQERYQQYDPYRIELVTKRGGKMYAHVRLLTAEGVDLGENQNLTTQLS